MSHVDEIRLMAKVARMYYDHGIRQNEITERLGIYQSTVSRLLKRARKTNMVRISVMTPPGIFAELEDALEQKFDLKEAIVVDTRSSEEHQVHELGAAAAFFIESTVKPGTIIGISSWSRALMAMGETLHPTGCGRGGKIVQLMGGIGTAETQYHATHAVQRIAYLIGAEPMLLQAPGVVGSVQARRVLSRDISVRQAADLFEKIDLALVGIGSTEPSSFLVNSGNAFSPAERREIRSKGAVGSLCLRFFDAKGNPIKSALDKRVIGIELDALKRVERVVGIAAGPAKVSAILGTLLSRRLNALITDRQTAKSLLDAEPIKGNAK
ncbi:MAG: sugar-binding transcriptional regulator [Edaphobacter sp.]